jgi:hypothetical protein
MLSHLYQTMSVVDRPAIDREVDHLFVQQTGITAKLDWSKVSDRPQARAWLRIRDVVVAKFILKRASPDPKVLNDIYEKQVEYEAWKAQSNLAAEVKERGLPEEHEEPLWGKIVEVGHLATEAFDVIELADLWPLVLGAHAAHAATLYVTGILAPFMNLLGGLYAIGHANEAGQRGAERNAFKWGFASTIARMAAGKDWQPSLPTNTAWGHQQLRGRNAAVRLLKEMGKDVGLKFLQRYTGGGGKAKVLEDMGGYD